MIPVCCISLLYFITLVQLAVERLLKFILLFSLSPKGSPKKKKKKDTWNSDESSPGDDGDDSDDEREITPRQRPVSQRSAGKFVPFCQVLSFEFNVLYILFQIKSVCLFDEVN